MTFLDDLAYATRGVRRLMPERRKSRRGARNQLAGPGLLFAIKAELDGPRRDDGGNTNEGRSITAQSMCVRP